jgi:undecaprenyl diphosphate synthase
MDGNRRWAAAHGLPVFGGHKKVLTERIEPLIEHAGELGIKYITFWAWSSENWNRPEIEVKGIMRLFRLALERYARKMIAKGARLRVIGDMEKFPKDIQKGLREMMEISKDNTAITVTFALNYGGRDELLRSFNKIAKELSVFSDQLSEINKNLIEENLDTVGMPDPDLIIRPGGTKRLSGFMLWQSEYAELYFTDVLMPDFDNDQFDLALADYATRERRFGGGDGISYQHSVVGDRSR